MKFVCQLLQRGGAWEASYEGQGIGPILVTGATREEAQRKLEAEIRYWLEMCPCTGERYRNIQVEVLTSDGVRGAGE